MREIDPYVHPNKTPSEKLFVTGMGHRTVCFSSKHIWGQGPNPTLCYLCAPRSAMWESSLYVMLVGTRLVSWSGHPKQ